MHQKNRIIKIDELEYLENLITEMEKDEDLLFKLERYFLKDVLDGNNIIILQKIKKNLNKEALKLLTQLLMGRSEKQNVLCFIDYLKANYNGKNTISLTDPESRCMKDKKRKYGFKL